MNKDPFVCKVCGIRSSCVGWNDNIKNYINKCPKCKKEWFILFIDKTIEK